MSDEPAVTPDPLPAPAGPVWFQRLTSALFVVFCFELGLFLVIYPWTEAWSANFFSAAARGGIGRRMAEIWNNSYLRGAVSGLGFVNIWIAMAELFECLPRAPGGADEARSSGRAGCLGIAEKSHPQFVIRHFCNHSGGSFEGHAELPSKPRRWDMDVAGLVVNDRTVSRIGDRRRGSA